MNRNTRNKNKLSDDKSRSLGFDRIRIEDESKLQSREVASPSERALLVGLCLPRTQLSLAREHLEELELLARTAGAEIVDRDLVVLRRIDPSTYIGKGKVAELAEIAQDAKATLVVFDEDLAPAQARNLEQKMGCRVLERSGLILDIFAHRAQTREARTQVELAQLRYMLPRLAGAWTHLERQKGGIGLRGPGETQIETDRRIIRDRIRTLEKELEQIERTHRTQRGRREQAFRFALAGYTNVGKSTLMNVLTGAGVYEENLLFATLDSTTRALDLGFRQDVLISDTVGFIRKLPPALVASFRSTLAEIREANCILHLIDLASPSVEDQMEEVEKLLQEMQLTEIPQLRVFNKVDAVEDPRILKWAQDRYPDALFISARQRVGIDRLETRMRELVETTQETYDLHIPVEAGSLLAELHQVGDILATDAVADGVEVRVRLKKSDAARLGIHHLLREKPV